MHDPVSSLRVQPVTRRPSGRVARERAPAAIASATIVSVTLVGALAVVTALLFTLPAAAQGAATKGAATQGTATPPAPAAQPPAPVAPSPAGGTQPDPSAATSPEVDPDMQRVAACKAQALEKLKQRSPTIEDIYIDIDGLTIATAEARLGDTDVKGVIMGEAYIQRDRSDTANRFLCLTGPKGEVLFTFFTER
ncbi:hypothetical protein MKI84_08960 [Ancylobacter sp. A5.8]|uniref:hypothetical protein n=1 Tax=Ancylobacter gelatini TaxID=2919920 RepID=UPI001F4F07E2|nr:hypothetical protein [Ancylobacter gelatini]MCJ8143046.1 hypothetical protein [Ancylobacter gelatini]